MIIEFCVLARSTERLDRFLASELALSRSQAARIIGEKGVLVEGAAARASRVLARGDLVRVEIPEQRPSRSIVPADIPLRVVHEDDALLILDKPAGLVVHPAPGHWDDTLVNALAARGMRLSSGAAGRPGIVHRLDRDTSGLMVVAKTDGAHRRLAAALAARRVTRCYAALAWGHLDRSTQVIDAPLARHRVDRKRMAVAAGGRSARTDAFVVARFALCDLLRLELHSGRTHQIRVHLAHVGHPVIGDQVYGAGGSRRVSGAGRAEAERLERLAPRQALHAAWLRFRHPTTGDWVEFTSDWPADLVPLLQAAAGETVAQPLVLRYLGFFEAHG